ncbi:Cingulin [Larimichthys crocea]|uniref:Cingulin n=1 Tax=Larimichthys crocea TaxID=215358 RepID=A0A6G0HSA2_LARCR|nr:Cingulin [Larimichthys crocea]
MKSPEKKKARKSTTQAAGFSHLTEFAPPPTPMVDHLVASNPFDDDYSSSRPSGAGGPASAPFLPSPGAGGGGGYGGGGGRIAGGMGFMGGPGGPGGGQPGRRPPFGPPANAGPHHQLGFGGMPGFGGGGGGGSGGGGGGGGFPPGGPAQFNMPPNFSPPMHPGPGFNPMLSPGGMGGPGGGGPPHPRFGMPPQQQHGQGGHPFNSPPLPGGGGPRGPPHGPLPPMGGGMGPGMNMMGGMGGGPGGNMVGGLPGMPPQGQFPPSQDGPYPGPSPPGPGNEDGKNFGGGGPPPGPQQQQQQQQQQLNLNPNGPPPNNATPGPPPNSGPPQPGGGFPGHPDIQQPNANTPGQPQHPPPSQLQPPNNTNTPNSNNSTQQQQQQQSTPPNSAPGSTPYNQQNNTPGAGGPMPNAASNSGQNNMTNNNGGNTPGSNPNPPSNSTSTPNTQSPLPPGPAAPSTGPGSGPGKLGGPGMVFPCGLCLAEVHDDQDAILCEASCQRWFHRDCTGLTEPAQYRAAVRTDTGGRNRSGSGSSFTGVAENQEVNMSTLSTDRKPLVDYGVQIRFIKDLHDTGEDEDGEIFGSPLKRPPGDGQAGTQVEEEGGAGRERQAERQKAEPQLKATASEAEKNSDWTTEEKYNEAGLKPVKLNGVGPKGAKQTGSGFTASLGRYSGKNLRKDTPPQSEPPASTNDVPVPEIDTNSLAPINKLISKFNSATPGSAPQARGRSGARQRLRFDERRRSRSLDARKDVQPEVSLPSPPSPTLNPYAVPLSTSSNLLTSSAPASGSLGRSPASVAKVTTLEAPKPSFKSPRTFVAKDTTPAVAKKPEIPPRTLNQSKEVINGEEAQVKQAIFNILKEGTSESEGSLKRKVNLVYETTGGFKTGGSVGSFKKANIEELQEQLSRCKKDLQNVHDELAEERMSREMAECRLRLQEDQLAELQEELRRVSENSPGSESLQMDVVNLQADLAEATMLRQRQEDTLHMRERELTALKGALKEEVECHDREMEALREQYGQDMESLRRTLEQSQDQIEEERQRVNASIQSLEDELESSRDQGEQWKMQLEATTQELHSTTEELLKSRLEKEEFEGELKDLQDSLLAMKKQMPALNDNRSTAEELQRCHDDLKRARADLNKQKAELDEKREALQALKKANEEKEAELLSEISRLKEQSQKDKAELERELEKAKESPVGSIGKTVVDHSTSMELQEANNRLRERLSRMTRLHSSMPRGSDTEEAVEALENENRSLKTQLEEAKRGTTRLSKERDELTRRLEERDLEREALRRGKSDLEEQKRLLDRALEKINKEMEVMMGDSRQSVAALQTQLDDYRERSRKDLLEAQRNSKDRLAELQRAQSNLKVQQDEVSRLKKELLVCSEERDSAQLERDLLNNRLKHFESELETEKSTYTDRTREIRGLEDKIKTLEIELDEERSSVELQNDRIARSRDQVDQLPFRADAGTLGKT